ncbi:MAG: dimethylaniline monooxygenase (N-oxide forming) [Phenylobacterium sp.]|jgi:dimethylaniline monooxygenase (N-oxide forming)
MNEHKPPVYDVCIIGAGWAGLLACKYAIAHNLTVKVLEKREDLGGVWNFSPDPALITVMESTVTSSSATMTEASDFYMKPELGQFVHRKDIHQYLHAYAHHFDLLDRIRFNTSVAKVEKKDHWTVNCETGDISHQIQARNLIVCNGINGQKKPLPNELQDFAGIIDHGAQIKSIKPDDYASCDGQQENILVYGGGESASDVVELLDKTDAKITWSIPDGQHFFRKVAPSPNSKPGEYAFDGAARDEVSLRFVQSKPGMKWLCALGSTGSVFGFEGHGITPWRKNVPFMHAMANKNGHAVEFVHSGRVTAQGKIAQCRGQSVKFTDGTEQTFSRIILCTGYQPTFPFLPKALATTPMNQRYKMIFQPDDPSLLFLGFVRPTVGSIPLMTEMQCRYAFKVLSDRLSLPDKAQMETAVLKDIDFWQDYFHHRRRTATLVEPFIYGHDLARLAGVMPHYGLVFLTSPIAFFKSYFSPMSSAHFELVNKETREHALKQIWSRQRKRWFVLPWLYLLGRLLRFDPIIDWLSTRKQQQSSTAKVGFFGLFRLKRTRG